ncbi:MAG: hypothetical protein ACRDTJ_27025, partial [Pseudonocardiaceae bacterium]
MCEVWIPDPPSTAKSQFAVRNGEMMSGQIDWVVGERQSHAAIATRQRQSVSLLPDPLELVAVD